MEIDSCRKYGQELQVMQLCNNCNRPLHFECRNCIVFVDDLTRQRDSTSQSFLQHYGVNENYKEVNQ